ncbi:MAG: hypothetical protein R3C03_00100 [Pirellulaceae bacterium]
MEFWCWLNGANAGEFRMWSNSSLGHNTNTFNSDFANSGLLDFQTNARLSQLVINGNSGNSGSISFKNSNNGTSILNVNNTSQFLNSGSIHAYATGVGPNGSSYIRVNDFANTGVIVNESGSLMVFDRVGSQFANTNTIEGTNGGFSFSGFSNFNNSGSIQATTLSFTGQGVGTSSFINSGILHSLSGNLSIQNTSLTNSGTISGAVGSALSLTNVSWVHNGAGFSGFDALNANNLNAMLNSNWNQDLASATISNSTIDGPGVFNNQIGSTLNLQESTFNSAVVNNGLIYQNGTNNTRNNWLNNGLTNNVGGEVEITYTGTSAAHHDSRLNVDGNIENSGTITLQSQRLNAGYAGDSYLSQSNGTLTNHSGGLIQTIANAGGSPGRNFISTDSLINNGTIRNNNAGFLLFGRAGASYINNGLIDAAAQYIHFNDLGTFTNSATGSITGQHLYLYGVSNSSGTVSNAGSINLTAGGLTLLDLAQIDNSGTINVSGGDINVSNYSVFNNAGSIQSASGRSMSVAGGTWNHNVGASINGGDQLTFTNSTINLNNALTTDFANVRLTNTTVNGPATWTNASGTTLLLEESTFNSAVVNNGLIRQERTNRSKQLAQQWTYKQRHWRS